MFAVKTEISTILSPYAYSDEYLTGIKSLLSVVMKQVCCCCIRCRMRSLVVAQAMLPPSTQIQHLLCMTSTGKLTKALKKCVSE